jgi:hypothetical protein
VCGYTGVFKSATNFYILLGGLQEFSTINEAAYAYDNRAVLLFGDTAELNFPEYLNDYREVYCA